MNIPEFGSLQMQRTNKAHVGNAVLSSIMGTTNSSDMSSSAKDGIEKTRGNFENYLLEAVEKVNNQQIDVNKMQKKLITDPDSVDIHDVTTSMAKAQLSLSLAQTVIDRIVSGWNEITANR